MLLQDRAVALGAPLITVVPETPDPALAVRPDMPILRGALIGLVELKAPGKARTCVVSTRATTATSGRS